MNPFDITVTILLLWSAYKGFTKGFIIQIASIAALILGVWGAIHFSDFTQDFIIEKFHPETKYISIVSFAITFIGIVVLIHLGAKILEKLLESVALGIVNKLTGVIFSVLKMGLIVSFLISLILKFDRHQKINESNFAKESILFTPITKFAPTVFPYFKNYLEGIDLKSIPLIHSPKENVAKI